MPHEKLLSCLVKLTESTPADSEALTHNLTPGHQETQSRVTGPANQVGAWLNTPPKTRNRTTQHPTRTYSKS